MGIPGYDNNADLNQELEDLPQKVSEALSKWRIATLNRKKTEALAYIRFRGEDVKRTASEIKALINADGEVYQATMDELLAESQYTFLMEKLLAAKRQASLRTAY